MLHTALMITHDQVDWFAEKGKSFASETWPAHSPVSLWALSYLATGYDGTSLTLDLVSNSSSEVLDLLVKKFSAFYGSRRL